MPKILFIGDLHYSAKNAHQTDAVFAELSALLGSKKHQIDSICLLGDVFDKEKTESGVLNRVRSLLIMLTKHADVTVLVGNHDGKTNQLYLTNDHILVAVEDMDRVTVVSKPIVIQGVVYCPYVPPGRFVEALETLGSAYLSVPLIVAHQEFANADFGTFISKHGDEWPLTNPMVVSGHIHTYSRPQPNILYVGTPYEVGFGDVGEKTVSIIDTTTLEETRVAIAVPRKITINIDIKDIKTLKVPEDNNLYRITISGDEEKILLFKKTKGYQKLNEKHKLIFKKSEHLLVRKNEQNLDFVSFLRKSVASESKEINNILERVLARMGTEQANAD